MDAAVAETSVLALQAPATSTAVGSEPSDSVRRSPLFQVPMEHGGADMATFCQTLAASITELVTNCTGDAGLLLLMLTAMVPSEDDLTHMEVEMGEEEAVPRLKSVSVDVGINCCR